MIQLHNGAQALGLTLTADEETRLARFLELLLERNQHVNLTAITEPREVASKHFLDSLSVETIWHPRPGDRAIDIGTGAGFPGIPLAIRHPEVAFVLNDSVRKKVDFLRDAVTDLRLPNVVPFWERAETLGRNGQYRQQFNVAFARAVAHLGALIEYALPLLKVGGTLIAMKGPSGEREIPECAQVLALIGGEVTGTHHLSLPEAGERLLIAVRKTRVTRQEFPREPGMMKKKPLFLDSTRSTP
ncbi:MAG TPA: 16S rRNA (guanine(527)-N(7))-methyltransferase RsmG [Armatimonadota bacterium]